MNVINVNNVIIYSLDEADHLSHMRVVFQRLWENKLKLKPSKCKLFQTEIAYLAHHVSKNGITLGQEGLR